MYEAETGDSVLVVSKPNLGASQLPLGPHSFRETGWASL